MTRLWSDGYLPCQAQTDTHTLEHAAQNRLGPLVPGNQPGLFHARQDGADGRAADPKQRAQLRLRRQALRFIEQPQAAVVGVFVDVVALRHPLPRCAPALAASLKRDMTDIP